jgi:hypothetical protein
VAHCEAWAAKFTGLLHARAGRELADLHERLRGITAALERAPADLAQARLQAILSFDHIAPDGRRLRVCR